MKFLKFDRVHLAAVVGALLAAGCGWLLHGQTWMQGVARLSYDLLHLARGHVRAEEAVLVYMDEDSHKNLGQVSTTAWKRSLHAQLIQRLTTAGARAIVFDVLFRDPDRNDPDGDRELAQTIKESGRVILAAESEMIGAKTKQVILPFEVLFDAAGDTNVGLVDLPPEVIGADLEVRQHVAKKENVLSSLSWAAARLAGAAVTREASLEDAPRWMSYYGAPNFLRSVSYYRALVPAEVPDSFFRGKAVFIGARTKTKFAGDRKDEFSNPFCAFLSAEMAQEQQALFSPGVEVQATAFLNLFRGDWLTRLPHTAELVVILGLGLVVGGGLIRFRPVWATGVAAACLVLAAACFFGLFAWKRVWFPWLIVAAQIGMGLSWSVLFNSVQLYVEKRLYEQTLRLHLPPKLVKKYAKQGLAKLGAEKETLTLFFSDVASFTSISEGMDSDELEAMMNEYFQTAVSGCIHKTEGTVSKFLGDGIFAFWNAPDPQADHRQRACEAALLLREQESTPIHGRMLPTRIGVHTGVANVGNFGSQDRFDYTALGDSVNLTSRLEGLNKYLGTKCLISGVTHAGLDGRLLSRPLGKFQLKGFEGLVEVHELIGRSEQAEVTRAWREAFAEALANYEQRNLEFAEAGFRRVLELKPNDGPSEFYLKRIEELAREILPENWATHTVLKEK